MMAPPQFPPPTRRLSLPAFFHRTWAGALARLRADETALVGFRRSSRVTKFEQDHAMIDVTRHLTPAEQQDIGSLFMSDCAVSRLRDILRIYYDPPHCEPAHFAAPIARSVGGFLTSVYFKSSAWFRCQPVHVCGGCAIVFGGQTRAPEVHVISPASRRFTIVAPNEYPLPENYFAQRLIEEIRVECGMAESAEPSKERFL